MTTAAEILTPPEHGYEPGTARAALSYRKFRIIFTGLALSNIGTWMQNFTLPAYIDDRTGRPALVGVMVFMQLGPLLVLSIPAGVLADRVSKQKLQVSMQALSAVFTLLVAYFVAVDAAIWTLFASQLVHRDRQRVQCAGVPVVDATARAPPGPPRGDQPQLGDDERHPRRRPGPRRTPGGRWDVGVADLRRQLRSRTCSSSPRSSTCTCPT